MDKEVWKLMVYPGVNNDKIYVSNKGRLMNINTGAIYKQQTKAGGYRFIHTSFGSNEQRKNITVHRAVAFAFVDNPRHLNQINHKDGVKSNNSADNLEWCTPRENQLHKFAMGLCDTSKFSGEKNGQSKLDKEKIKYIRENCDPRKRDGSVRRMAKEFNVCPATISKIVNNKAWMH